MGGRNAGTENFPVASRLLPAHVRPHVMAFYAFARAADDIADAPGLSAAEKRAHLERLGEQLRGGDAEPAGPAPALRRSLGETGVTPQYAHDLLSAFLRDADNPPARDWADLMDYCRLSAAPVGRYLIDLTGGAGEDGYAASDALCAALQVLNHLQDVRDDYLRLRRIYMPADWMAEAGAAASDLAQGASTPAVRRVIRRMLEGVDQLLAQARPLPAAIRSRALAREAAGILAIAHALARKLRARDPLAGRVALSKPYAALLFLGGALRV